MRSSPFVFIFSTLALFMAAKAEGAQRHRGWRSAAPLVRSQPSSDFLEPLEAHEDLADQQTEASTIVHGRCPFGDGRCKKGPRVLMTRRLDPQVLADAQQVTKEDLEQARRPEASSNFGARLSQAIWSNASQCRSFSKNARRILRLRGNPNSCAVFGRQQNAFHSKGWCAGAVGQALGEVGVRLPAADAYLKRRFLTRAGFTEVRYSPDTAPAGTVFSCDGGRSICKRGPGRRCGHMEIVTEVRGQRYFCSDFCSTVPTCNGGSYFNQRAYQYPGT